MQSASQREILAFLIIKCIHILPTFDPNICLKIPVEHPLQCWPSCCSSEERNFFLFFFFFLSNPCNLFPLNSGLVQSLLCFLRVNRISRFRLVSLLYRYIEGIVNKYAPYILCVVAESRYLWRGVTLEFIRFIQLSQYVNEFATHITSTISFASGLTSPQYITAL